MDFILNKLLLIFVLSNIYLGTDFDLPRHDIVILDNGAEITCKVQSVADGLIKISTHEGERTIVRELNINDARDMVEAGIIKTTRYSGKLTFMDPECLELETSSGIVKIKKSMLKKIIISQKSVLDL